MFYQYGVAEYSGEISNLSPSGAFIETDYQPDNGKRYVELAVVTGNENVPAVNRIKALIIYFSEKGFGLMTKETGSLSGFVDS